MRATILAIARPDDRLGQCASRIDRRAAAMVAFKGRTRGKLARRKTNHVLARIEQQGVGEHRPIAMGLLSEEVEAIRVGGCFGDPGLLVARQLAVTVGIEQELHGHVGNTRGRAEGHAVTIVVDAIIVGIVEDPIAQTDRREGDCRGDRRRWCRRRSIGTIIGDLGRIDHLFNANGQRIVDLHHKGQGIACACVQRRCTSIDTGIAGLRAVGARPPSATVSADKARIGRHCLGDHNAGGILVAGVGVVQGVGNQPTRLHRDAIVGLGDGEIGRGLDWRYLGIRV